MPRLPGLAAALALIVLVAGCQPSLTGAGRGTTPPSGVTPNAIAGAAIEVTPLDDVAPDGAEPAPEAADQARAPEAVPLQTEPPDPQATAVEPAPVPAEDVAPPAPKSAAQLACEKKGGTWVNAGNSSLKACVKTTRDSGKQCTNATQCESTCLARSGTCAPMKPLLGCNEVLQDNGTRVTQCIE